MIITKVKLTIISTTIESWTILKNDEHVTNKLSQTINQKVNLKMVVKSIIVTD